MEGETETLETNHEYGGGGEGEEGGGGECVGIVVEMSEIGIVFPLFSLRSDLDVGWKFSCYWRCREVQTPDKM